MERRPGDRAGRLARDPRGPRREPGCPRGAAGSRGARRWARSGAGRGAAGGGRGATGGRPRGRCPGAPTGGRLCSFSAAPRRPPRAELDELRVRIGRDVAGAAVRLEPLSGEALRDLARWALPRYNELELNRVARRVGTDSAGIPLLAVELLHAVAMGLDLRETTGAWPEPFKTLDQTLPGELPDAVVAAIRIGFRRLSPDAQRALAVAAVVGGRVSRETLGSGSGLQGEGLDAALDELEWQRWLAAEPRGYALVARIVRDVVAQDMVTEGQRQRILAAIDSAAHPM